MGSIPAINHQVFKFVNSNNRLWLQVSVRKCCQGQSPKPGPCKPQNKPVSVADRTINLANPSQTKYCVKPVQRSLTVTPKPCAPPRRPMRPAYPTGTPINVCKAGDMKKICPPKPCACPPCKPPETWQEKLKRWLIFLLKAAVTGGVVYWTIEEGVWGSGDEAVEIYQAVWSNVLMIYQGSEVDARKVTIPKADQVMHEAKQMWNKGVVAVCGVLGKTPGRLIGMIIKPPECPEEEDDDEGQERGSREDYDADQNAEGKDDDCA